ncbi:MAG: hypothetical protein INR68_07935 [Methylobacterium mesophilicum]|nr:hypothetical protein [Methylobacterium mesophilicum]
MSSSNLIPRYNQVDQLTRGLDLPFVALQEEHLFVMAEALVLAWNDLLISQGATLRTGSEAEINALMATRLSQLIDEHSLWEQMVRSVTRGTETVSFDGGHLEKRPDLSIHLTARNPAFPLIVECKLIDAPRRKTAELYCDQGLRRLLSGEYSWATREAFMLAYVRDGSSVASALNPLLAASRTRQPQPYTIEDMPTPIAFGSLDLARTRHGRLFRYPTRPTPRDDPGTITLWHLWLTSVVPQTTASQATNLTIETDALNNSAPATIS